MCTCVHWINIQNASKYSPLQCKYTLGLSICFFMFWVFNYTLWPLILAGERSFVTAVVKPHLLNPERGGCRPTLRLCVHYVYCLYVSMYAPMCLCVSVFASNEAVFVSFKREGCINTYGNSSVWVIYNEGWNSVQHRAWCTLWDSFTHIHTHAVHWRTHI